jgi:acyl-CoA dehydrogenase
VIYNFPNPLLGALMRRVVFPLGRPYVVPADALGHDVAVRVIEPGAARDRLTSGTFIGSADEPVGLLERALATTIAAEPIEQRIFAALRQGTIEAPQGAGEGAAGLAERALARGVIDESEARLLALHRALTAEVVRVDDFAPDLGASLLRASGGIAEAGDEPKPVPAAANADSDLPDVPAARRAGALRFPA